MLKVIIVMAMGLMSNATRAEKKFLDEPPSAASRSQVMFALENKYDNTGPGATRRENAYKTFNTLEDALINYLSDPDTKLPDYEKSLAVAKLMRPETPFSGVRQLPKTVGEYTGYRQNIPTNFNSYSPQKPVPFRDNVKYLDFHSPVNSNILVKNTYKDREDPFKLLRYQAVKESPLNVAHYTKEPEVSETRQEFNSNPQYSFSYGVHDRHTGDSKSVRETRDGDVVKGYYTFMDADGMQRTVHYTADEKQGFRATVERKQATSQ